VTSIDSFRHEARAVTFHLVSPHIKRTLVDLAASKTIRTDDILEAIQFRSLNRKLFTWLRSQALNPNSEVELVA
jgi:hypothetical protein